MIEHSSFLNARNRPSKQAPLFVGTSHSQHQTKPTNPFDLKKRLTAWGRGAVTTTTTAETATEAGSELAWGTTLLALALLASPVTALTVTTVAAWAATASTALTALFTTHHAAWGSVAALLLDVGLRNDLSREVEPLAQVVETLWGEGVVVVLPGELGLEVAAGGQRLAGLDDVEVAYTRVGQKTTMGEL